MGMIGGASIRHGQERTLCAMLFSHVTKSLAHKVRSYDLRFARGCAASYTLARCWKSRWV
jgi:hypothetical protein